MFVAWQCYGGALALLDALGIKTTRTYEVYSLEMCTYYFKIIPTLCQLNTNYTHGDSNKSHAWDDVKSRFKIIILRRLKISMAISRPQTSCMRFIRKNGLWMWKGFTEARTSSHWIIFLPERLDLQLNLFIAWIRFWVCLMVYKI